ncbi:glycosyltransferase [Sphingomonas sp. RB3P16]|uniref:glycosyltransferase n=1 Tax=Parasphingomonas frigoris TaxID=3096163 RepID=UPI002FC812E8
MSRPLFCVCVPARNEAARLPVLLDALAAQTVGGPVPVAICINNSDDGSVAVAEAAGARHAGRLDLMIDDCRLAPSVAHAGTARGRAMAAGYDRIGGSGLLVSTDADCRPPRDWLAATMTAYAGGATLIGGRIELDDAEPIAPAITAMRARFDQYWTAVRAIEDAIDPVPHDPPARHGDHTGASLAIDAALYRAAGGVPAIPTGEDRALVIAALGAGGRLVHPVAVWTRVSARTEGRAAGGMALAMAELADTIDRGDHPTVPAFAHWAERAHWRRATRATQGVAAMLAAEEALPPMPADMPLPNLPQ